MAKGLEVQFIGKAGRVIRVDADVYAALEKQAKGFDTPNAVLRRILGLDEQK